MAPVPRKRKLIKNNGMNNLKTSMQSAKEFIIRCVSSGLIKEERRELDLRILERIQGINIFCINAVIFIVSTLMYFSIVDQGYLDDVKIAIGIIDLSLCVFLFIYMRITRNINVGGTVVILFLYSVFLIGIFYTSIEGFLFIYISIIPYLFVYLKGPKQGFGWLVPFAIMYLSIIILANKNIISVGYSVEVLSYLYFGFINLSIFSVVSIYRIQKSTETIEKQLHEITRISKIDFLTNVYNKRAFFELMDSERKRTLRHDWWIGKQTKERETLNRESIEDIKEYFSTFSVLLLDIDHFKRVNQEYGYSFGDKILKSMGTELMSKQVLRENDITGRFGGEEFIVLMPETNSKQALLVAERIRETISSLTFSNGNNEEVSITVSIGISEMLPADNGSEDVIKRADTALYNAKDSGRNCSKVFENI